MQEVVILLLGQFHNTVLLPDLGSLDGREPGLRCPARSDPGVETVEVPPGPEVICLCLQSSVRG